MKAVRFGRFGAPEVLELVDLPDPHPGPGQVRVAVRAVGVSPSDTKFRAGELGGDLPQTTGHDLAGVVDLIGPGVDGVAVGDRVFGSSDDGAALPSTIETATRALDAVAVASGSLLVNGASGSIGSAVVQLAVARGLRMIGTAGPANRARGGP